MSVHHFFYLAILLYCIAPLRAAPLCGSLLPTPHSLPNAFHFFLNPPNGFIAQITWWPEKATRQDIRSYIVSPWHPSPRLYTMLTPTRKGPRVQASTTRFLTVYTQGWHGKPWRDCTNQTAFALRYQNARSSKPATAFV